MVMKEESKLPKQKKKAPKFCSRCGKQIRGRCEEIVTKRHTKPVLCEACVRKGL